MERNKLHFGIFFTCIGIVWFTVSCELLPEEVVRESTLPGSWSIDDATAQVYVGNVNITRLLTISYGYSQEEADARLDSLVEDEMGFIGSTLTLNEDSTYSLEKNGHIDESGSWAFDDQKNALKLTRKGEEVHEKYTVSQLTRSSMKLGLPNRIEVIDLDRDGEPETNCTIIGDLELHKKETFN